MYFAPMNTLSLQMWNLSINSGLRVINRPSIEKTMLGISAPKGSPVTVTMLRYGRYFYISGKED